jgi:hypothetical protein
MTKLHTKETIVHPQGAVSNACQLAVADLGWRILAKTDSSITCKEVSPTWVSFTNAAQIEVLWREMSPTTTEIELNGSILGFGPIQSGHLRGQMGNLQNRIHLFLNKTNVVPEIFMTKLSISEELERLADMRSRDIISDEEFRAAKAKILG